MRRLPTYIHERPQCPPFNWSSDQLAEQLAAVRHQQGRLLGRMEAFGFQLRAESALQTLTEDVLKSSEIEDEILDRNQVRSSIARRLDMDIGALAPTAPNVEGVVAMTLDATQRYQESLVADRLFGWHAALFPTGYSGLRRIATGTWRDDLEGPMQVVSGPIGANKVHFEAVPADRIEAEMAAFFDWFHGESAEDPVMKAAIAHLWFVTIHPFDDGNGRIARAITDMALARSDESPQRFYSMSAQIRRERTAYYAMLEATQKGDLDITRWLQWFLACLGRAFEGTEHTLADVLQKVRFWESVAGQRFTERQRTTIDRLLDGFVGKLTSTKWAQLTKTSPDTALRDINDLVEREILAKDLGGGRSTSYSLALPDTGDSSSR